MADLILIPILGSILLNGTKETLVGQSNTSRWVIGVEQEADPSGISSGFVCLQSFRLMRNLMPVRHKLFSFFFGPLDPGMYSAKPWLDYDYADGVFTLYARPVDTLAKYTLSIDTMHSMHR